MKNVLKSLVRPIFFRIAEKKAGRAVTKKIKLISRFYNLTKLEQAKRCRDDFLLSIRYAFEHVPYYKKTLSKNLICKFAEDEKYLADFPVLTKDDVIEAGDDLISDQFNKASLRKQKTGGSSGKSAYFYYDKNALDWSAATTWFCRSHYESLFSNKQLHFACDFDEGGDKPYKNMRSFGQYLATNRDNIFTLNFDENSIKQYMDRLIKLKPNIVHGHPSTMYMIAQYVLRQHEKKITCCNVFESSGEVLLSYQIKTIQEAFGCQVVNRYGLAEAGVIAYQLNNKNSHMQLMNHLVVYDKPDVTAPQEICISTLRNFAMPLIRYKTGDIGYFANLSNDEIVLKKIEGRVHDVIELQDKKIMTHAIMDVLDHRVGGISEFQIVKSKRDQSIVLNIVPQDKQIDINHVYDKVRHYFGVPITIKLITDDELIRVGDRFKFRHLVEIE